MKIGVISDTHDRLATFRRAVAFFQQVKVAAILHAGDFVAPFAAKLLSPAACPLPVHAVMGNNDGDHDGLKKLLPGLAERTLTLKLDGRVIVMCHKPDWLKPADTAKADVVITGHTHQATSELVNGKLRLNPGECCGYITDRPTIALLDLTTLKTEIIEVHE